MEVGGGGGGTITRCNTGGLKVKDLAGENTKVEQGRSFCILSNTRFLSGERSKTRKKWEVGVRGGRHAFTRLRALRKEMNCYTD